jgi:hypothetical protein
MAAPELASDVNAVHVPSGMALFPNRTLIPRVVTAAVLLVHDAVPQFTVAPASKIRERKVPELA